MVTLEYTGPRSFRKQLQLYSLRSDVQQNSRLLWEIAEAKEGLLNEFTIGDRDDPDIYLPSGNWQAEARILVDDKGNGSIEGFGYVAILSPGYEAVTQSIGPFRRVARIDRLTGLYATDENKLAPRILNGAIKVAHPRTRFGADSNPFVAVTQMRSLSDGDVVRFGPENSPYLFRFRG